MQQLVNPNLDAVGRIGWCLEYAAKVFGCTNVAPTAIAAWEQTQLKHEDQNFPDVAVPIWFTFEDAGHVAVRLPSGEIYSSPWQPGTTHAVLTSIPQLIDIYSDNGKNPITYLGWSEDILGLKVIQGDEMTQEQAQKLSLFIRLLAFESVDEANSHSADDVAHMLADPAYAGAIAETVYRGEWQNPAYKAGQYDAEAKKVQDLTDVNLKLVDQITALKATPVATPVTTPVSTPDPTVTVTQSGLWAAFKKFLGLGG